MNLHCPRGRARIPLRVSTLCLRRTARRQDKLRECCDTSPVFKLTASPPQCQQTKEHIFRFGQPIGCMLALMAATPIPETRVLRALFGLALTPDSPRETI